ncbi:MAG: response regulator [Nitrospirae bacterium]|nr:response regulator [Nitrospirota bacterium]
MSIVTLFSASGCRSEEIVRMLTDKDSGPLKDYVLVDESEILEATWQTHGIPVKKLIRSIYGKPSVFNAFTHEKECHAAYVRAAIAASLERDGILYEGFSAHLIPDTISHVLRVCLVADIGYRQSQMAQKEGSSEKEAAAAIQKHDNGLNELTQYLFQKKPWDASIYDILIPTDKVSATEAVEIVARNVRKDVLKTTDRSARAVGDFILASRVNVALTEKGHDVLVSSINGDVTITIDKYTMRLKKLEEDLRKIVSPMDGVRSVDTVTGPNFNNEIYHRYDFEFPAKVLVVDDEKDFALTLNKRLQMRDVGSAAVFSGEEALSLVDEDIPDVMVLDLKMPGVDGMEVLRQVKKKHPRMEVIILTGQGTEKDRQLAKELGVYAYFEKPVDIEKLTESLKEAYKKINEKVNE